MKEHIQFKKQREIGAILSDTFKFIRNEWKPLLNAVIKTAGPALLIMIVAYVIYEQTVFSNFGGYDINPAEFSSFTGTVIIALLVLAISGLAFYTLLYSSVLNYIKSYIDTKGVVDNDEVRRETFGKLGGIIGLGFLSILIIIIGFVLCIIPGIYAGTVLAVVYAIYIFEKRDVTDSISQSFKMVNKDFWNTFAAFFVIQLIIGLISFVTQLPATIYTFVKMFAASNEFNGDFTEMFDWVYTLLNALTMVLKAFINIIFVVSTALVYFNLNEKQNFTGTIETIESLGKSKEDNA